MKFDVFWSPNAEARLADVWLRADDRAGVTEAARKIDVRLTSDAMDAGESREGNRRIYHESPLGVIFSVDVTTQTVLVLDVWQYAT